MTLLCIVYILLTQVSLRKMSSLDPLDEEDVQLLECAVLGLRESKVCPDGLQTS